MFKTLIGLVFLAMISGNAFASDSVSDTYHQRIEERYQTVKFENFKLLSKEEVPIQIQELQGKQLNDLLQFAEVYDLYRLGWSYSNHNDVFEVTIEGGEVVLYTFSDVIFKDGVPRSRRFYQATKRVDGVFFIERISDYDL